MLLSLIVAMDRRRAIGRDNALPWKLSDDLRYFKQTTLGKPVIMGRRTFESIGRPLPGRSNLVITRNPQWRHEGCQACDSLAAALLAARGLPEAVVIGGGQIYAEALAGCARMHVTHVDAEVAGDTWFPALDWDRWRATEVATQPADARNSHAFRIVVYDRIAVT